MSAVAVGPTILTRAPCQEGLFRHDFLPVPEKNLDIEIRDDSVRLGPHLRVTFQRTLRIPDDGQDYPLPPGLGRFPVLRAGDYASRVPAHWGADDVFIPMYQREALWLSFECPWWRACAVKVRVGGINAVSGKRWHERLNRTRSHQDHLVCPDQPWLDGINAGDGFIRQFVAMPLGMGYTVEGQLTGSETRGGIQLLCFEPKPGRFPDKPTEEYAGLHAPFLMQVCEDSLGGMGLGAGGRMRQEIYPDEHGPDTWDPDRVARLEVHIVDSLAFRDITGLEPPPTPVSAELYTRYGLPWFELYDEGRGDLRRSRELERVRSVREKDAENGFGPQQDDSSVAVDEGQVLRSRPKGAP
jgi:hypothetical protein